MNEVNWSVVEQQMSLNKGYRVKWKAYFGMSLTRLILKHKAQGLTPTETYNEILKLRSDLPEFLKKRIRIGVAARYGESGTYDSVRRYK